VGRGEHQQGGVSAGPAEGGCTGGWGIVVPSLMQLPTLALVSL
jgi:hypothetical protein